MKVSFFLAQADLPKLQDRMAAGKLTAMVTMHDSRGTQIEAPVDFIGNQVNPQTGTIELRATFDNADYRLVPGQLLDVKVAVADIPHALVVPREAVYLGPDSGYVYVVDAKNRAQMVPSPCCSMTAPTMPSRGVKPGDKVVTDGQDPGDAGDCGDRSRIVAANAGRGSAPHAMNISEPFIRKPVMTTLLMAALVIFGVFGYSDPAGQRIAERGFPHHLGLGQPAGRRSGDHGVGRRPAAGKPVSDDPRHQLDDVAKHAGLDLDHHPVQARPQHRRRGAGRAGGDLRRPAASCRRNMPTPPTLRKVNPADSPIMLLALTVDHHAAHGRWTITPRPCWRASFRR